MRAGSAWNTEVTGRDAGNNRNFQYFGQLIQNTGGHFFKVIASNSDKVNTSQILPGSTESFGAGEWHIGFNITRILAF